MTDEKSEIFADKITDMIFEYGLTAAEAVSAMSMIILTMTEEIRYAERERTSNKNFEKTLTGEN